MGPSTERVTISRVPWLRCACSMTLLTVNFQSCIWPGIQPRLIGLGAGAADATPGATGFTAAGAGAGAAAFVSCFALPNPNTIDRLPLAPKLRYFHQF